MTDASVPMTTKGHQRLIDDLKRLKTVERPKNVRDIEEARGHGDLSENAEFHAAKDRQSLLDVQIREIEDRLARPSSTARTWSIAFTLNVTLSCGP